MALMDIPRIGAISPISPISGISAAAATTATPGADFGKLIGDLMNNLAQTERNTDQLVTRAAAGDDVDVHDVMIAMQSESLAFQVGLQVRNHLVGAYQEVFRMQV
jgi:flagellar hook-basal body complex protein FliE